VAYAACVGKCAAVGDCYYLVLEDEDAWCSY